MSRISANDRVMNFVEELAWLMKNYSDVRWDDLITLLKRARASAVSGLSEYMPSNPNIAFLVGILPGLFMDRRLFRTNKQLAEFARKVLGIQVSRYEKRSQYELIGLIVCEVTRLDDRQLETVAKELRKLVTLKERGDEKSFMGGWSATIRRLMEMSEDAQAKTSG